MLTAETPVVARSIHNALANTATTTLEIKAVTATDAQCIVECLQNNPRLRTLHLYQHRHPLNDNVAVLNVIRDGLPLCTAVTTVILQEANLGNEDLDRLRPAFYNTFVMSLDISDNNIQGKRGGEVLCDLLVGNKTLLKLNLNGNQIGPEGLFAVNKWLQKLDLIGCQIGNDGLANLLLLQDDANNDDDDDDVNMNSLTHLNLNSNNIRGAEGGRLVRLLLHQRFPLLKVLCLENNPLGADGARALARTSFTTLYPIVLETLHLSFCGLGNEGLVGVAKLIFPSSDGATTHGDVNRSLTNLRLCGNNIQGHVGGKKVVTLAARCVNLDSLAVGVVSHVLSYDQERRLNLLLDRKRLVIQAKALAGSPFSALFRFVEQEAHSHEHGLSAVFVILQNDSHDYFYNAHNRTMQFHRKRLVIEAKALAGSPFSVLF